MRAHPERSGSNPAPRIAISRADRFVPRRWADQWEEVVVVAVPAAAPCPAEMRALAFAASLGPVAGPRTTVDADDIVIDLAGEEALLAYLASLAPAHAG